MDDIDCIKKLKDELGERIYTIAKYGFGKRNLLLVMTRNHTADLVNLKPFIAKLKKTHSLLVMSRDDILNQNLGIDFLNIKLTSAVIYGKDVFKELEFNTSSIKRHIKYEANRLLIALKNEYLSQIWPWKVKSLLYSVLPRVLPLVVAHLYVKGEKIPNAIPDTINKYAKYNEDAIVLLKINNDLSVKECNELFKDVFSFLGKIANKL